MLVISFRDFDSKPWTVQYSIEEKKKIISIQSQKVLPWKDDR